MKRSSKVWIWLAIALSSTTCKTSGFRSQASAENAFQDQPPERVITPSTSSTLPARVQSEVSELQVKQTCERPVQLLIRTVKINFPERMGCRFGQAPNQVRQDAFVQAHEISRGDLELPENAEICEITLEAPNAKLHYDDFIVLALNNQVIFASNKMLVEKLEKNASGVYTWDFTKVVGSPIALFEDGPFCIAPTDRCRLPAHDKEGDVYLKTTYIEIASITKDFTGKSVVPVSLIATGDNDDQDCFHSLLTLDVTMRFIKR